jgi:DNA-binding MarR family transcriptional regulator
MIRCQINGLLNMPEQPNAVPRSRFPNDDLKTLEKAVRRIVRAHDLNSKALIKSSGLTSAQLVMMKAIAELGEVTSTALSAYADISLATVVTVLDNLEERGIIQRYRSGQDRRVVHTRLTEIGAAMVAGAPPPLGHAFAARFAALRQDRRRQLVMAAGELADLLLPSGLPVELGTQDAISRPASVPSRKPANRRAGRVRPQGS